MTTWVLETTAPMTALDERAGGPPAWPLPPAPRDLPPPLRAPSAARGTTPPGVRIPAPARPRELAAPDLRRTGAAPDPRRATPAVGRRPPDAAAEATMLVRPLAAPARATSRSRPTTRHRWRIIASTSIVLIVVSLGATVLLSTRDCAAAALHRR